MIGGSRAAERPGAAGEDQSLPFRAARPPDLPNLAQVTPSNLCLGAKLATLQKSADSEEPARRAIRVRPERTQRQTLGQQLKGQLVLAEAERHRQELIECLVRSVRGGEPQPAV